MLKKLLDLVDDFIENFSKITNLDEIAVNALNVITKFFNDEGLDEISFDEIMQKPGLWRSIGEKLKKSLKSKEDLLKQLLYICTVMNEFDRRYRTKQKEPKKDKDIKAIIDKYSKYIQEISENKNLSQEQKNAEIRKMRTNMEKELKELEFEYER